MNKVAVVTGAGSGVGQACARALLKAGWSVALLGRREETLRETVKQSGAAESQWLLCPCDIGKAEAVQEAAKKIRERFGGVEVLVNAAGTNAPQRSLEVLSMADYQEMINTNMHGAYYCVQAFLPEMRKRRSGTIVNIASEAALQASPKAGPAYVMSKFAMRGLTQAINAEEKGNGIRACALHPGDIDTPLLNKRPSPPPAEARQHMLRPEDVAECVMLVINLPGRAVVEELLLRPGA